MPAFQVFSQHFLVQSLSFKTICRNNAKSGKIYTKLNKLLVGIFYHFQLIFCLKLSVIIAPNNSLEFTLTWFAEPVAKEKE